MSRILVNTYRWLSLLAGLACLLAGPVGAAPIVATPQLTPKRVFKVCLLLLESQKNAYGTASYWNPDPWILPVLNRSLYKPTGWVLDNPLAPGIISDDAQLIISGNYYSRDGKGGGKTTALEGGTTPGDAHLSFPTNWYLNGRRRDAGGNITSPALSKDDPAYWVVKLDQKSIDALAGFDLVIVNGHSLTTLTNGDRDNLQLLLNRGATIWLNNSQREGNQLENFFMEPKIILHRGSYTDTGNNPHLVTMDPNSWLLDGYYKLADSDVAYMRDNRSENSYIVSGFGGLLGEVARMVSKNVRYADKKPAIAAGSVGAGQLIVTATDCIGATSDWWEYQHNYNNWAWPATLGTHPYYKLPEASNRNPAQSYAACGKLFYNMLAKPAIWHMAGGNVLGSRFFPQAFSTSLRRDWLTALTLLGDPVAYGEYVAASGISANGRMQIQVYKLHDVTADRLVTPCFDFDAKTTIAPLNTTHGWYGSPVFNRIILAGQTTPVHVVYALEGYYNAATSSWMLRPRCFLAETGDPVWTQAWQAVPCAAGGIPTAAMTLSNNRLVVTVFGRTVNNAGDRIYLLDATSGHLGAAIGGDQGWGYNFRLTGPASIVTAPVDFQLAPSETGDMRIQGNGGIERRKEMVELLAVPGEVFPGVNSQAALFLIPPMTVIKLNNRTGSGALVLPTRMEMSGSMAGAILGPRKIGIENASQDPDRFRQKNIVALKYASSALDIVFRNFDIFVSSGVDSGAAGQLAKPKLSATAQDPLVLTYPAASTGGVTNATSTVTHLSMGYPIILRGTQQYGLGTRSTLRARDGDGASTFGYAVDTPPVVVGNQLLIGTNCLQQQGRPYLQSLRQQDIGQQAISSPTDPRLNTDLAVGGALTAYRITSPELGQISTPAGRTAGDIVWQFFGNTLGPAGYAGTDVENIPQLWHSDFPLSAAAGKDAVFTIGFFDRAFSGKMTGEIGAAPLTLPANNAGAVLYALDPSPSRYLEQVVTVGSATRAAASQLSVALGATRNVAFRTGARALLRFAGGTWDLGHVLQIRGDADPYAVIFDRAVPDAAVWNGAGGDLLIATSVPYLSHIRGWDQRVGASPVTAYTLDGAAMTRVSQGILSNYKASDGAANPFERQFGELLISFNRLEETCHAAAPLAGDAAVPADTAFPPAGWANNSHLVLPRLGGQGLQGVVTSTSAAAAFVPAKTVNNFSVDYRAGRIELAADVAGQYADRFVVVHYLTREKDAAGNQRQVHHAEVMHVPSQVIWQYEFGDAVPDGSPTIVNDVVYVTAHQRVGTNWQPMLFAFDAHPADPLRVQPKSRQPVGPSLTAAAAPYRGVTAPIPVANGILVGTALAAPNGTGNQLALFADRGTLIADGHRIVRVDGDGQVSWQASATKGYDPAARTAADEATKGAGVVQQDFTLISRIQRLRSGNILVCDTGGNRVVEMDREGTVVWQYPDSDLALNGTATPANLRLDGPRDARRYELVVAAPDGSVSVHWDVTLIADAGNNRVLEIRRPTVRYAATADLTDDANIDEYQYLPALTLNGVRMVQAQEVVADGRTITCNAAPLAVPADFVIARRCPTPALSADLNGLPDTNWVLNAVRSRQLLAVIGNAVPDPLQPAATLRTAVLERADAAALLAIKAPAPPAPNGANAFKVRKAFPFDLTTVRQLDFVTLTADNGDPVLHVLVVDGTGVREIPWDNPDAPVFEMRQTEYAAALNAGAWATYRATLAAGDQAVLDSWLANDKLFAPVAVLRIDPGSAAVADQPNVRYLISQMNTLTPRDDATRRIHLFEARYTGPPVYDPHGWGIIDATNGFYLYPNPLSPDYPNLPGTSYPLAQPVSIDRD